MRVLLVTAGVAAALAGGASPAGAEPNEKASCNAFLVHGLSPPGDLRNNFGGQPPGPFGRDIVSAVASGEHRGSFVGCLALVP